MQSSIQLDGEASLEVLPELIGEEERLTKVEEDEDAHRVEADDIDMEDPTMTGTDDGRVGEVLRTGIADSSKISGGGEWFRSVVDGVFGGHEVGESDNSPAGDVGKLDPSLILAY